MKKPIFISYRIKDTAGYAGRLSDALRSRFPDQVFLDAEILRGGMVWAPEIEENVRTCEVFLVVIGDGWLKFQDPDSGMRRLDQSEDWVRREIEIALARDPQPLIVPVLVGDSVLPKAAYLPASIIRLPEFQHETLDPTDFEHGIDRLVGRFPKHLRPVGHTNAGTSPDGAHVDAGGRQLRLGAMVADYGSFLRNRLDHFVGRASELATLTSLIAAKRATGGYVTITGEAGQGKSSIIAKLIDLSAAEKPVVHVIPFNPGPDHQISLLRNLLAQLALKHGLSEIYAASETRPVLRHYFSKVLQEVLDRSAQETIFIDGLDQIQEELNGERDLTFLPLTIPPGIVCVVGTRPNDTLRPLELLSPHQEYKLPVMSEGDFHLMLQRRGVKLPVDIVSKLYRSLQAHALYLDLAAKELAFATDRDPADLFARLTSNPESVFSLSIDRQKLSSDRWHRIIRPILGVLLVAQEPLSESALRRILQLDGQDVREGLLRLGGLVNQDSRGHYQLFHLKFYDYLRSGSEPHTPAVFDPDDELKWHHRVAEWCGPLLADAIAVPEARDVDIREQERWSYALDHLAAHLYHANEWPALFNYLDSDEYRRAKLLYDPSTRSYGRDLEFGCRALLSRTYSLEVRTGSTARLWRYCLRRISVTSRIREFPEQRFTLLVLRGRHRDALELLESLSGPEAQSRAMVRVGQAMAHRHAQVHEIRAILLRSRDLALQVRDPWRQAEVLLLIVDTLVSIKCWDDAAIVSYEVGSHKDRLSCLGKILDGLACAGHKSRFSDLLADTSRLAALTGTSWPAEGSYRRIQDLLTNPALWIDALSGLDASADGPVIAKALIGPATEAVLDLVCDKIAKAPSGPWFDTYLCVARYLLDHPGPLTKRIPTRLWSLAEEGVHPERIRIALLLDMAGFNADAVSVVTASLKNTRFASNASERSEALLMLGEDIAELTISSGAPNQEDETLEAALQVARTVESRSRKHALLQEIADGFVRGGNSRRAAEIYMETGGGPLVVYQEVGLVGRYNELTKRGDHLKALSVRLSQQYFKETVDVQDWNAAIKLIESLETPPRELNELENLKRSGASRSDDERTRVLTEVSTRYHESVERRVERMSYLIQRMFAAGKEDQARKLLPQAREYANRLPPDLWKLKMIEKVFEAAVDIGDGNAASALNSEILAISREHSKPYSDHAAVVGRLIHGLIRVGHSASARTLIETDLDDSRLPELSETSRHRIWRILARSLWRLGNTGRCLDLLHRHWPSASSQQQLLALLPLASTIVCRDPRQRADLIASLVAADSAELGEA